jgi:hypothetical protein
LLSEAKSGAFAKVEEIETTINRIFNGDDHEGAYLPTVIHSIQRKNISAEILSRLPFIYSRVLVPKQQLKRQ